VRPGDIGRVARGGGTVRRRRKQAEWKPASPWSSVVGVLLPLLCLVVIAGVLWGTA
jgi:hypothetical protein